MLRRHYIMEIVDKQTRINEAEKFFNLIFGNVTERKFGYLWTKQDKATYPFTVSNSDERKAMAKQAIELADKGFDVYFGVNLMDEPAAKNRRVTAEQVTLQTATVTDIDVEGGNHISNGKDKLYPPNFDVAKSFLPCPVSILVDSGFGGVHGYCLYSEPITITHENRAACETRNRKFIEAIRRRAGVFSGAVDGVGDLPRVLRVPGTFNYKLGASNAPLVKLVEANDVRFTPDDMDKRLNALTPQQETKQKEPPPMKAKVVSINTTASPTEKPSEQERAIAMLDAIPCAEQTYEDWLNVGIILKNNGNTVSDWTNWSRNDSRFKEGECEKKWQGFKSGGLTIATLHKLAQFYGYSEGNFQRDWYRLRGIHEKNNNKPPVVRDDEEAPADVESKGCRIIHRPPDEDELKARLAELQKQPRSESRDKKIIATIRELCTWNHDKNNNRTTIKATVRNIKLIFDNDPYLRGLFGFDKFQEENIFLKKAPWSEEDKAGEKWRDSDDANLRTYLREHYAELKERQLIEDYVIVHSGKHSFHPVKKFFETLPQWDKTPRAETLFVKFLGAEDSEYTREVTLKWLLGFVARVYHPGCDFQWCPVLQGAQRIGKSKLVKMLGGKEGVNPNGYQWHVALKDSVDDAHSVDALQKGGIIEIEEFSAARKAEINALKSFISAEEDTRRFAYDRRATTRKRHCVFVVTCNDQQFLRDTTGNARFWIVECSKKKFNRVEGMTPEYIRQVWAEIYYKYDEMFKDGFAEAKLKPSEALEIRAEEIADAYIQDDGMTLEIKSFLNKRIPPKIIWKLMTKEDRRKFFTDGQITFDIETLNYRRRAQGGREQDVQRDIDKIYKLCNSKREDIQQIFFGTETSYRFYGSELREHICAAEIFNEAFANGDKRKVMYRINEILTDLEGWHLGDRLRNADPEYREQKKPYYRDENNRPTEENETAEGTAEEQLNTDDELKGEPIETAKEAMPFDPDDLPI